MATTRLIPLHVCKSKTIAKCLRDRADYAENSDKTREGELVSSYECAPKTCDKEFLLAKREYLKINGFEHKGNIIAYQIRQAFKPGEVTPEEANRVGYETAMRWTKGKHAFIVATHIDRAHIHNHIIFNSTTLDCTHKWHNFWHSSKILQKVSDIVCIEHGLSTITNHPYGQRTKYDKPTYPRSLRDALRADIEEILATNPCSFAELLKGLSDKEYEIKQGATLSLRGKGNARFIRLDTLGREYTELNLKRRIAGEAKETDTSPKTRDFNLILDIEKIIQKNKGSNYERWAKSYNLKQTAKALCFLQERGIKSFSELVEITDDKTKCFNALSESVQKKQKRLEEIAETKHQIVNYAKTRETYEAYKRSGYNKKFFEFNREELQLHQAAKEFFNSHNLKKLPKMKELSEEYGRILAEKRKDYAEYKEAKASMQDFLIARQNIETILGSEKRAEKERCQEGTQLYEYSSLTRI